MKIEGKEKNFLKIVLLLGFAVSLFRLWEQISVFPDTFPNDEAASSKNIIWGFLLLILYVGACLQFYIRTRRHIIIVGATGTGKSILIDRFLQKKKKEMNIVLVDGCDVLDSCRKGKEVAFPAQSETCEFLIIDSISLVKETPHWDDLIGIIRSRHEKERRTVLVVQSMSELEDHRLGSFMCDVSSGAYVISLDKSTSLSKALRKFKRESNREVLIEGFWKLGVAVSALAIYLTYVRPQIGINLCQDILNVLR